MNQSGAHLLSCTAGPVGVGESSQTRIKNGGKGVGGEAEKTVQSTERATSGHYGRPNLCVCVCVCQN